MKLQRHDLQELSSLRLPEAQVLIAGGCWEAAYYLAGYAVECALKACIAKSTERYEFPDMKGVNDSYEHNLEKLVVVADLNKALNEAMHLRPQLGSNWSFVKKKGQSRPDAGGPPKQKRGRFFQAVQDQRDGVHRWLKKHW